MPNEEPRRRRRAAFTGIALLVVVTSCVSEDPGAPALTTCDSYCRAVTQNCGGDRIQYKDEAQCKAACALLDLGSPNDSNVNTVACRERQAKNAKTLADCVAAGPFGGGVCGTRCAAFCQIVGKNCFTIASPPYGGSEANCDERCPGYRLDPDEGEGPNQSAFPGKDTINCRSHHVILSLTDPVGHCPHADVISTTCK